MKTLEIKSLQEIDELIKKSDNSANIPRYIFQTWETNEVPEIIFNQIHIMKKKNPDWIYCLFTDAMCRAFIEKYFDKEVLAAYDNLIPRAYKADLWRYCVLYHYGGIYIDIKMALNLDIANKLNKDISFFAPRDRFLNWMHGDYYVINNLIYSRAKHPILQNAISEIIKNTSEGYYGKDQLHPTGPALLGKAVNLFLGNASTTPITPGVYRKRNYLNIILKSEHNLTNNIHLPTYEIFNQTKNIKNNPMQSYGRLYRAGLIYKHKKVIMSFNKKIEMRYFRINFNIYRIIAKFNTKIVRFMKKNEKI